MMYPEYAKVNNKLYKIDTDFKTALKCFKIINDDTIHDYERAYAVVYLLFNIVPETDSELELFLDKAKEYLQCGKNEEKATEPDVDFEQDKGYIVSSFMSDYHVDLTTTKMHFWLFIDLIEGLTDNSALNRIRDIRNFDINEIKDAKRKKEMIEAKKRVALKKKVKHTKEQKEMANKVFNVLGIRKE